MRLRRAAVAIVGVCVLVVGWAVYRQRQFERGHDAFLRLCADCHDYGGAPNLSHVATKYDRETMVRFVTNPEDVYRDRGRPLNAGYPAMARVKATPDQVALIVSYLRSVSQ